MDLQRFLVEIHGKCELDEMLCVEVLVVVVLFCFYVFVGSLLSFLTNLYKSFRLLRRPLLQ